MPQSIVEETSLEPNTLPQSVTPDLTLLRGPQIPEFLNRTFAEIFEQQVKQNPSKTAVVAGNKQLSFAELNDRANQLAHHLRSLGVGRESIVGICIDRSLEMAIGIVGILKSGGAYLPLDPDYPKDRLAFMIQDAQPSVVVTKSGLLGSIPADNARVVLLDEAASGMSPLAKSDLAEQPLPTDLAYVIYTSGSTGTPKGALIDHRNLANYLLALDHELGIRSDDVYLHLASIAFSSSRRQLLLPLSQGATVVIASSEERKDPLALFEMIKERGVTVMDAVPSFWRSCTAILKELDEAERRELLNNRLRLMLSASEPLMSDIPRTWANEFQHPARHVHMFGQTETAGIVCVNTISIEAEDVERIPIGHPIANTEILIMDEQMNAPPAGVPGELYIGGAGVGRGYLNRPELTAEKFITFANKRLYRAGDFARVREHGRLEFAGRHDQQIKIRGFRVELGEVEAALTAHAAVRECAVVAKVDAQQTMKLVAYFVPETSAPAASELRRFLSSQLPDYATPSTFVALDALPLSANGKTDRLALARRTDSTIHESQNYVAPRTELEIKLAGIHCEVLHLDRIGIDDNFFEMGGNSLLAGQSVARVRRTFKVRVPVSRLFEWPTVREFAAHLEAEIAQDKSSGSLPLVRVSREQPLPLSFSQQRLWFLDQLDPGNYAYNLAQAMEISGVLNTVALRQSLNAIVARHEILRTRFIEIDGTPFQTIDLPAEVAWQFIDLSQLPPDQRLIESKLLLETESRRPFDLSTGPLLRALLVQLAADNFILLLTVHHIVSDAWSAEILMKEVSACYEAYARGETPSLTELPIQYADYSVWQRSSAGDGNLELQLDYWKRQLNDAPPVLNLPTDFPRAGAQSYRGGKQTALLSRQLSDDVRKFARAHGATLFMTLLAIFDVMLALYTGSDDVIAGTPMAGRDGIDTELLIGFFVNTLALRTRIAPDLTLNELIKRVRETAMAAFANQDVPFEMLVTALRTDRSLEHNPIFQVMFVLQDGKKPLPTLAGAAVQPIELNNDTSKFDLSLEAVDADEIEVSISYNSDLFESESARCMLADFQRLLKGSLANPNARLSQLPKVTWEPKYVAAENPSPVLSMATTYIAPQTPIEEKLAAIWTEVLAVEGVGVADNFFMLGGHSLMAAQVISRIRAAFNYELPLRQLFETPTIAGLAHAICEGHVAKTEDDEFAALLAELEGLSEDEAQAQFAQERVA
ncbi:MAG TPA: amino acid adenylation domain-containing protein [Pyrinomonadaceae bacterium]|nr:amino acid adenylation domain-containing protein [Pyrinomonadaceae bacterium]